ncbi:MAG: SRPBCC family protein [Gammaproteobacteria bacterium]|nr:SRPBCC family protein [Gammaproteobacteria bacterium]
MKTSFSSSTAIARPPHDVWKFITDFNNAPLWMSDVKRVHQLDEGELGRGSILRYESENAAQNLIVSYWEPDKCFTLSLNENNISKNSSYKLEAVGKDTLLQLELTLDVKGMMLFLLPFVMWSAKRRARRHRRNIKQVLELNIKMD